MRGAAESPVCPRCAQVYGPESLICPACDVRLVIPGATGDPRAGSPIPLVELRSAPLAWIERLQRKLARAQIFHRTAVAAGDPRELSIQVRPDDLERAKEIDREVYESEVPEAAGAPRVDRIDTSRCPGCGEPLTESDGECPGCGLSLDGFPGWRCASCGTPIEERAGTCPRCGAGIDWIGR